MTFILSPPAIYNDIRSHLLGPMGGLKIGGPLYTIYIMFERSCTCIYKGQMTATDVGMIDV